MMNRFLDLWGWQGKIGRLTYAAVGVTTYALKYFIDRSVSFRGFGRIWYPWSYFAPFGLQARVTSLPQSDQLFGFTMLLIAIPFIWLGVTLTVQRLRDAGQPVWLVGLFFVPVVNLLFFLLLCVMPSRRVEPWREAAPWPETRKLDRYIPEGSTRAGVVAIVATASIGLVFAGLGMEGFQTYGLGLFVALPFCLGLFSTLVYSYHQPRTYPACLTVSLTSVGVLGAMLMVFALDGLICILMAAPFALGLAALGSTLGCGIQSSYWYKKGATVTFSAVLFFSPSLMGFEQAIKLQPHVYRVQSAMDVNAPPEKVWQSVVAFTEIPPPTELIFRAGIAYPIRAEITGRGAGAVRRCVFSTGPFVEPIEVWDEPRLLKFGVRENPAPMHELSPYGSIQPAHLHGYFVSRQGQFLLTALPGGHTRIEGSTWYQHTLWPEEYWHLWSDYIIHKIHLRVLEHIKTEAEK